MSFEGYVQILCKNGHYWEVDCYDDDEKHCSICGEKPKWRNLVDITNGSFDFDGSRCDGYIHLEVKNIKKCTHCGSILETRYKIPKK